MTTRTMIMPKNSNKRSLSESSAEESNKKSVPTKMKNGRGKNTSHNGAVITSRGKTQTTRFISNVVDITIRVVLVIVFIILETTRSFKRKILLEDLWLYKYPRSHDYVSPRVLLSSVILGPLFATVICWVKTRSRSDFLAGSWTWTLILGLNGLITSLLKITVGRPRPDFYYRCFPDGVLVLNNVTKLIDDGTAELLNCTGNIHAINEGRKSFPSGHSSFAFASFGFIALYAAAKLHVFTMRGRGQTWRLFIALTPLVLAGLVAISRVCDYHHHWQDVFVGSLIGLCTSYLVYRQYYPSIYQEHCDRPYKRVSSCGDTKIYTKEHLKTATRYKKETIKYRKKKNESETFDEDLSSVDYSDDFRPLLTIRPGIRGVAPSIR